MGTEAENMQSDFDALVEAYRTRCLWFLRQDYVAKTPAEKLRVLSYIERHGDLDAFRRSATLRTWLSRHFSEASAGS